MKQRAEPLIFGHRGASSACPENTLAAFREAAGGGAAGIELDTHLSADGKLVVCHDETVNRTTNGKGFLKDMTSEEIRKLDAGSWFAASFAGERVPFLEEVLELCGERNLEVNIELKTDYFPYPGIEKKTAELVAAFGMEDRVIVSSFNHYSIVAFKGIAPRVRAGLLYNCRIYRPERYAGGLPAEALHPAMHLLSPQNIADAHGAGYEVNVWFYGETWDEEAAERNIRSGVDRIITNFPRQYAALLSR